jgi:multidrug efflux system membrane fusion protein
MGTMFKGMNRNFAIAGAIAIVILAWVVSGLFAPKPHGKADAATKTTSNQPTRVQVAVLKAEMHEAQLIVRGRTQAMRSVQVRAETAGPVSQIVTEKGTSVKSGDVLCQLQPDARQAQLAEAKAQMEKAQLDYQGSETLAKKGFRSQTQVAAAKAALDAAAAGQRQAEIELERTNMRAPFDGVVDNRFVNVGDYMKSGDPCEMVVDLDPILIVGAVSENAVGGLSVGSAGRVHLVTGLEVDGRVRFVAQSADPATRTFTVEAEVPNPDFSVKDGLTAEVRVGLHKIPAHHISPAILTLDDGGRVGVRTVVAGLVKFMPVELISDDKDGVWIAGLPETVTVITVGQEYVTDGEKVDAITDRGGQS